jgi:hypothetical protein
VYRLQPAWGVPHAYATLGIGLTIALKKPQSLLPVLGYLTGCELLWRMNQVPIPFETGKLFGIFILAVALARARKGSIETTTYLLAGALFLPAVVATVDYLGWGEAARSNVSFHLSGPTYLALGAAALASLPPSLDINRVLAAFAIPTMGLGAFILYSTLTTTQIRYTTESNFATSGGFGPNQVSLTLALGALALAILATATERLLVRLLLYIISGAMLSLSVFTFSRTGLYCAVGGLGVLVVHLILNRRRSLRLVLALTVMLGLGFAEIFPRLDQTTGGMLSARFASTDSTSRLRLIRDDWQTFLDHPFLGVGVGISSYYRRDPGLYGITTHTEYSRAAAEHGILGIGAWALLLGGWYRRYARAVSPWSRAAAAALGVASGLALASTAVRLAAIPFFLILAFSLRSSDSTRPL